ncbi:uncharacterized protein [Haliotis asinina]|uniref:uncharacterized protein n=1 Tax=Haliotis asinina TaxID=109174 RepID=UPI0035321F22
MVLRLCLCVVLLFPCGRANKSSDYCRVLVNYDAFKISVDQFLASREETCENTDIDSESKATYLAKRVKDLENNVANLTSESSVDCGSPAPPEGTDVVYSSTGLHAIANYRCKKGFLSIYPGQQMMSLCQKDGQWTMVNVKCVNISSCWTAPAGRALYTGTLSTTINGKVCQRWDSQTPQTHGSKEDFKFSILGFDTPQTVTGSANYCRDPTRSGYLWCYTIDSNTRWEMCDVPMCNTQD